MEGLAGVFRRSHLSVLVGLDLKHLERVSLDLFAFTYTKGTVSPCCNSLFDSDLATTKEHCTDFGHSLLR